MADSRESTLGISNPSRRVVGVSGTFNVIHRGHQVLLEQAFLSGDLVLIGLSSDDFARSTRDKTVKLTPFQERRKALQNYLAQAEFTKGRLYRIVSLDDSCGPALEMKDFHALVVSPETLPQGRRINGIRQERGLAELELILVPHVLAEDQRPISATRVLRKEIHRDGKLKLVFPEKMLREEGTLPGWLLEGREGQPVLVHSCCAGCLLNITSTLEGAEGGDGGIWPVAYWYNPNVHPLDEHQKRLEALTTLARERHIPVVLSKDYDIETFFEHTIFHEEKGVEVVGPREEEAVRTRCQECYRLRLQRTAKLAAALGIPAFTTTLLCSPYQDHEFIKELGEGLAREHGLSFLYHDFRKGFNKYAREYQTTGLHHQNYCGCLFSQKERHYRPRTP